MEATLGGTEGPLDLQQLVGERIPLVGLQMVSDHRHPLENLVKQGGDG